MSKTIKPIISERKLPRFSVTLRSGGFMADKRTARRRSRGDARRAALTDQQ